MPFFCVYENPLQEGMAGRVDAGGSFRKDTETGSGG